MMYLHYCKRCQRIHMLNGHKMFCPKCDSKLTELRISYLDFVEMDRDEREYLKRSCQNDTTLATLTNHYRMYKYSKWYKKLKSDNASTPDSNPFIAKEQIALSNVDEL